MDYFFPKISKQEVLISYLSNETTFMIGSLTLLVLTVILYKKCFHGSYELTMV